MMVNDFAYMRCGRGEDYYAVELTYGVSQSATIRYAADEGKFQDLGQAGRCDAPRYSSWA